MSSAGVRLRRCSWRCGGEAAQRRGRVSHAEASTPHERQPYVSSDGRPKYTMEEAFRMDRRMENVPWQLSWQRNERNLTFDDNLKVKLIKGFAAKELGLSDAVMEARLRELVVLLPDLAQKMPVMQVKAVALMAADTQALATKLLALRRIFPTASVSQMVTKQPQIVLERSLEDIECSARKLETLLPGLDVDRLVEQHPSLLDVEAFESALEDAKRMRPNLDLVAVMTRNPDFIFGFQRRGNMIPYDD